MQVGLLWWARSVRASDVLAAQTAFKSRCGLDANSIHVNSGTVVLETSPIPLEIDNSIPVHHLWVGRKEVKQDAEKARSR